MAPEGAASRRIYIPVIPLWGIIIGGTLINHALNQGTITIGYSNTVNSGTLLLIGIIIALPSLFIFIKKMRDYYYPAPGSIPADLSDRNEDSLTAKHEEQRYVRDAFFLYGVACLYLSVYLLMDNNLIGAVLCLIAFFLLMTGLLWYYLSRKNQAPGNTDLISKEDINGGTPGNRGEKRDSLSQVSSTPSIAAATAKSVWYNIIPYETVFFVGMFFLLFYGNETELVVWITAGSMVITGVIWLYLKKKSPTRYGPSDNRGS